MNKNSPASQQPPKPRSGPRSDAPGAVPYPVVHTAHKIEHSIVIDKPAHQIFSFWREFENLPHFIPHLELVEILGEKRSHWKWHTPMNLDLDWNSEIIAEIPGKMISWQTLEGSDVHSAGSVWFKPIGDGQATEVRWHLAWDPPGGRLGTLIGKALGEDPSVMMTESLKRLKTIFESGAPLRTQLS